MVLRDVIGLGVAFVILAGIAFAISRGSDTARIINAMAQGFANTIRAATLQG